VSEQFDRDNRRFRDEVARKASRKLREKGSGEKGPGLGLGMFGAVGWTIAVPTLVGIAVGIWIDRRWPSGFSWTLMLLAGGLIVGCLIAFGWVRGEQKRIEEESRRE
jgi:ATP synthase protein I